MFNRCFASAADAAIATLSLRIRRAAFSSLEFAHDIFVYLEYILSGYSVEPIDHARIWHDLLARHSASLFRLHSPNHMGRAGFAIISITGASYARVGAGVAKLFPTR
jgi:hypothetical protein